MWIVLHIKLKHILVENLLYTERISLLRIARVKQISYKPVRVGADGGTPTAEGIVSI